MRQNKLIEEQKKLSRKLILKDDFGTVELIGGVDQAYVEESIISAVVVLKRGSFEEVDSAYSVSKPKIPYIPGFLSYREGPVLIETINKLKVKPDLLFVDGNGILHPRKFGLACHVGLILDIPTIGIAKKLLFGEVKGNTVYAGDEAIAKVMHTREHAKPIYVSPGHRISLKTAYEIAKEALQGFKLPISLHLAHKMANKVKRNHSSNVTTTK